MSVVVVELSSLQGSFPLPALNVTIIRVVKGWVFLLNILFCVTYVKTSFSACRLAQLWQ